MQIRIRFFNILISFFIWSLAVSFEVLAGVVILHPNQYTVGIILLFLSSHCVAALLSFLAFRIYLLKEYDKVVFYSSLGGLITFSFPLIGLFGITISFLLVRHVLERKGEFAMDFGPMDITDSGPSLFENMKDTDSIIKEETDIEPILDILKGNDPALKRGAINLLKQIGSKETIHLIKECISDPNDEVRFYASTALKRLNDFYIQQISIAKKNTEVENPSASKFGDLGNIYKKYAESGLCDQGVRDYQFDFAKKAFIETLHIEPEDIETMAILGYVSMEMKEYEEAERYFKKALDIKPGLDDALLGLCRLYYEKWDLKALVESLRDISNMKLPATNDPYNRMLINFWTKPDKVYSDG